MKGFSLRQRIYNYEKNNGIKTLKPYKAIQSLN